MTLARAIEILEAYNNWRNNLQSISPSPSDIFVAIDTVVKHLKSEKDAGIGYWKQ